ncbi:DUF2330 domain-containing protein [Protaetiibacter larvae]|uniref:DUF2330 domain-containing protein n=1 Tax=Protaetiibacter larvae TaxID=2592654 RepID=A0A5C1YBV0_9MICO|nr:DUF2330 domain-containing protein [Protaetiibacter larvae]QEO10337.1 DUF2330 domain-containing protein [Protaetiibacter larvae]
MTRRALSGSLAALLVAAGLTALGIAQPAAACACGAAAPPDGVHVSVGEEHAIVTYSAGVERIDLVLDMLAESPDTGLIVPTPAPATVSLGERGLFDAVERQTAPQREVREDWWGIDVGGAAGGEPVVLSEVDLGPVQGVTLAASDAAGLAAWLGANGYIIDPAVQALLGDYVARGWSFSALKLSGEEPLAGALDPVRIEFPVAAPVYPLLLSQAASSPQTVRLYLFGDDGMQAEFADGSPFPGSVTWAGPVDNPRLVSLGSYLTVLEAYFANPSSQISGDLVLSSTGERRDYRPVVEEVRPVQLLGIPFGMLLFGFGVLVVVVLVLMGLSTRRKRTRRIRARGY